MLGPTNTSFLKVFRGSKHLLTRYLEVLGRLGFNTSTHFFKPRTPETTAMRRKKKHFTTTYPPLFFELLIQGSSYYQPKLHAHKKGGNPSNRSIHFYFRSFPPNEWPLMFPVIPCLFWKTTKTPKQ